MIKNTKTGLCHLREISYVKGFVINKAVNHISEISLIYPETKC